MARRGEAWLGEARRGAAWRGMARLGEAWQGLIKREEIMEWYQVLTIIFLTSRKWFYSGVVLEPEAAGSFSAASTSFNVLMVFKTLSRSIVSISLRALTKLSNAPILSSSALLMRSAEIAASSLTLFSLLLPMLDRFVPWPQEN